MELETMRVKCEVTADNDQGFYIINKDDYDASIHEPFDAVVEKQPTDEAVKPSWQK
jgi:hypothetical protein